MSVLTQLVQQRVDWVDRQKATVAQQRVLRALMGYLTVAILATVLVYHDKAVSILAALLF